MLEDMSVWGAFALTAVKAALVLIIGWFAAGFISG